MMKTNIEILEQGIDLIEALDPDLFARPEPAIGSSGVGAQLRHCLDFYACFLRGLDAGRIDYDERERDPRVESDRDWAVERMRALVAELGALDGDPDRELAVRHDAEPGAGADGGWARSSPRREARFLLSHTIHHYAIIAILLRTNGVDPGERFGFAPSTLAYLERSAECTR
jgi:hypothetical protein